jgi:hypothetical protein
MAIEYSSAQIDRLTTRALKLLSAVSQVGEIRHHLEQGGYTEEDHRRGWLLLLYLLGYNEPASTADHANQLSQQRAVQQLDEWDGPHFDRARAALEHHYPAQARYVFGGITAKSGPEVIGTVLAVIDRVAALRDGTDPTRADSRAEDAAAAQLLAKRRILTREDDQRLRALIEEATRLADLPVANEPDRGKRQQTARELEAWLKDWRETARVLVTRRDHQIRLGLAERRTSRRGTTSDDA